VRSPLTMPKMGLGSPPGLGSPLGLPKIQSAIGRVRTPCIEAFLVPLKSS